MGALEILPDEAEVPPAGLGAEEHALWSRWRGARDMEARERLLEMHLPYARLVAASYYGKRFHDEIEFDEYHQLATVGMIEAMERFDPAFGVQFRTFASRRMHGSIVDGLERTTEKQQQIAARQRLEAQRQQSIAGEDTDDQSERSSSPAARTTEQLLQHVAEAGLAFALSWLLDGSGMIEPQERAEALPFYRSAELKELRQRILDAVNGLPAQERTVIYSHYLQELPFEEVARRLSLTKGRISQVHKRALLRLRHALGSAAACDALL